MHKTQQTINALMRNNFHAFVMKLFEELHGGKTLVNNWHLHCLCQHLEDCGRFLDPRLIIAMPPRSLKSLCATIALPLWMLGKNAKSEIICVSYSDDLAKKFSRQRRQVLESKWYRKLFPNVTLIKNTENEVETNEGGGIFTTSVGGTLTGRGADALIIDDPIKAGEAMSEAERNHVNEWYRNTAYSRLNDKAEGVVIVVSQRIHTDDLVGNLLENGTSWTVVEMPAIAPCRLEYEMPDGKIYIREEGEALHPERESLETLVDIKKTIGSYNFEAQYQQIPVPPGGNMIQRDWFKSYKIERPRDWYDLIVQSWDTAISTGSQNSYSVCLTFGVRENRYFLLHVLRDRMNFPQLEARVQQHANIWGANQILIEKAASGLQLLDSLHHKSRLPLIPVAPDADKETRVARVTSYLEAGRMFLPEDAPWLAVFLKEVLAFPHGKFDDQVDAMAHFLYWSIRRDRQPRDTAAFYAYSRGADRYAARTGRPVFDGLL